MPVMYRRSISEIIFTVTNTLFMVAVVLATVYPVMNIAAISASADGAVLRGDVTFYPIGFNLRAYVSIFNENSLVRAYGNTLFVALFGCLFGLVMTAFAAYPLAYCNFFGKRTVTFFILFTMWFSGGMIPTYLVVRQVGLFNSLWALIIVPLVSAYNVIILTSFFKSIPIFLIESAKIDGANEFTILFRIVVPVSKPVIATVALWIIVAHWNDFFAPLMYLKDFRKYTLQVVLRDIVLLNSGGDYGMSSGSSDVTAALPEQIKDAVIFVSMIPMLIIYPFLQKYFVKGVMLGAIKG
jgi:putative aldouronate transport system permease protein